MKRGPRIGALHLYVEGLIPDFGVQEIVPYLKRWMKVRNIDFRGSFFQYHLSLQPKEERPGRVQRLAEELALLRIRDATRRDLGDRKPMEGEVAYEKRRIEGEGFKSFGILYDGFRVQGVFSSLIPRDEQQLTHCHIIFTNQLLGTWDDDDHRYHARVSVYGFPSLISIDHGDPHLTDVMKGYVMQALIFHMTGHPFCDDPDCRLYNAHWQEELIRAQLGGRYEFCPKHKGILNRIEREV
jgi:hypothetical protein